MLLFFKRYPIAVWPLIFASIMALLAVFGRAGELALRFDSLAIRDGEIWRIWSAHWVHLGWQHALLNIGGLLLLAWLQPQGRLRLWLTFYVMCSSLISLYWLMTDYDAYYVGASGVLHGLLILGAFYSQWLDTPRKLLFILAILIKLIWEQTPYYSNAALVQLIGARVAVDAHFLGGLSGVLVLLILMLKKVFLLQHHPR